MYDESVMEEPFLDEGILIEPLFPKKEKEKENTAAVWRKKAASLAKKAIPYGMIAPAMVVFAVFMIYPIAYMIYLSFFKWNMLSEKVWIGFGNFKKLFTDAEFLEVLTTTVKFMAGTVAGTIILALLLALYLKRNTKINRFLQSVVFAPYIVSLVSVAFIFMWMMDSDLGLLNYILSFVGIDPVRWLDDPKVAIYSLVLVNIWKGVGYYTLIFVSALQSIPPYLYEAAMLDRTGRMKTFFKITLPMISPTLFFVTLTGIISGFKVFETISIMTGGGNKTNTLVFNIYE